MKKFVIILAALCLVLSFAACGKKDEDKKSTPVSLSPIEKNGEKDDGTIYTPEDVLVPTEESPKEKSETSEKAPAGQTSGGNSGNGKTEPKNPGAETEPGTPSGSGSGSTDPKTPSTPSTPDAPSELEKESDTGVTTPEMAME